MDNRVESYVFSFSGDNNGDESPAMSSLLSSPSHSSSSRSSASSSSIGLNSEDGEKSSEDGGDENEVESPYKGSFEMMESLEEVLPVRKGISNYYNGKSKSFTNLAATSALTSSSSMKDLAKPENPYSRRRRNLLSHQIWETNNKTTLPRGGISKKHVMSSSKSALTLAIVMTGEGFSDTSTGSSPTTSVGSPPRQKLPPLYPKSQGSFGNLTSLSKSGFCAWGSYSVADLSRFFPATANGLESDDS